MRKIAYLTGAAGFLGRNMLEVLFKESWEVHAMLRSAPPAWMREIPNLVLSAGSLESPDTIMKTMPERCDPVFHVAGNISSWVGEEGAIHRDIVVATQQVIDAALKKSARRLIVTSTLGVFDTSYGIINEETPLLSWTSKNPYLRTKLAADALLDGAEKSGLSVVRMHPGHILGRYDRAGWISLFEQAKANKLGPAPRGHAGFCLASDVARAHLTAAKKPNVEPRYVLISADASYLKLFEGVARRIGTKLVSGTVPSAVIKSIATLSRWQAAVTGQRPTITPGLAAILTSDLLADSTLARETLDLPSTTLDAMLDETYAYWRQVMKSVD